MYFQLLTDRVKMLLRVCLVDTTVKEDCYGAYFEQMAVALSEVGGFRRDKRLESYVCLILLAARVNCKHF